MESFIKRYGLFLLFTVLGLLEFSYHYLDDLARRHAHTAPVRFIEEMTASYTVFVLMPFIIGLARRYPWSKGTWHNALIAHVLGAAGFCIAHTTLMAITRAIIFPLAGLGSYDYGLMVYRYPMEASRDVINYSVIVIFIYVADRLSRARRAELEAAELQAELAEAKLENLRLQLHPHFLFNTLNSISSVMYEDVRKADAMLVRLSDFLRVILSSTDVQEVSLDEELQIEGMYFNVMKARLETKLELSLDIEEEAGKALVPSLILQPLIENAIQHGMGRDREHLDVRIEARRRVEAMHISITDNGVGLAAAGRAHRNGGRGIANVKSRLSHLYGSGYNFRIENGSQGGTEVMMTFPYRVA